MTVGIVAGLGIVTCAVQHRVIGGHAIREGAQIIGIKVDHMAKHRIAALFRVERQQFAHCPRLAKRKKQVFGVVAIVRPDVWRRLDYSVHRVENNGSGDTGQCNPMDTVRQVRVQIKVLRHEGDHGFETQVQVMPDGAVYLDIVFGKDQCDRPFGKGGFA